MRVSEYLIPTLRETPAEAEIISHQLLLRAGFIRKVAAGVYNLLPLAYRVIRNIEAIVREEMDAKGGQEVLMPIMQPAELWLRSGRWDVYGPELMRLKDRHSRDFALGPTHEELITELVGNDVRSYKQLPVLLYQIQDKFRDERRPRFGLMRGREFIMKDLYSFDRDEEGLNISYEKMYDAYTRIFKRCGLTFRAVLADSGAIGGGYTHEFMVLAASGEATVIYCPNEECRYAANDEKAISRSEEMEIQSDGEMTEVTTPGARTVSEVATLLDVDPGRILKTLFYETDKELVAAVVRGNREVNEIKLLNAVGGIRMSLAGPEIIERVTGAAVGFSGPVGLKDVTVVVDEEVMRGTNFVAGANRTDTHLINVKPGRDFLPGMVTDIRLVAAGEICANCGAGLESARGIEVGQVFKLGDKYSKVMNATFLDEDGQERPFVMGCYGIGITRTMAAAVEQNYDKDGIIWPAAIAPFKVIVIPVNSKDQIQVELAERIYADLWRAGIDALIDDRNERPGVKFKDADLVGYPLRITVGKTAVDGRVEVMERRTRETVVVAQEDVTQTVSELLKH